MRQVFLPHVYIKRLFLGWVLGRFNQRAVLILDNCSCHAAEEFQRWLLEDHNVLMFFLPSKTSHLTQPLDVGVFGRTKTIIRSNARYFIALQTIDEAVADEVEAERQGRPVSTEQGNRMADFLVQVLSAFHQATVPNLVVSAFEQAGICSRSCGDGRNIYSRVAYPDPSKARLVKEELGLFTDTEPIPRPPNRQLRIAELNQQTPLPFPAGTAPFPAPFPAAHPAPHSAAFPAHPDQCITHLVQPPTNPAMHPASSFCPGSFSHPLI